MHCPCSATPRRSPTTSAYWGIAFDVDLLGDLDDVLRFAHDEHHVVGFDSRDGLAFIKLDRVPIDPVFPQEIAENTGVFNGGVLQNKQFHDAMSARVNGLGSRKRRSTFSVMRDTLLV